MNTLKIRSSVGRDITVFDGNWTFIAAFAGARLQSLSWGIQKAVTTTINTNAKDFYKGIQKLYERANLCEQLQGIYVEN